MEIIQYISRFLYRIRWYLLIIPLIAVIVAWMLTREIPKKFDVETTIYTGIISGYTLEGSVSVNSRVNMANLLNIIQTENTIKRVATRLLARCLMYGDPEHDNNYISAEHFRALEAATPVEVKALVDKRSETHTTDNLTAYAHPTPGNFVYGILERHPYFGVRSIASKLIVAQMGESDMIHIAYSSDDAGIAFNTLEILNEEFINQYQTIRFGETNNVIKFYEGQVNRLYRILCASEENLINYNISKRIINYGEQTKQVAILAAHKTMQNGQLMSYTAKKAILDYLEAQMGDRVNLFRQNEEFIQSQQRISKLMSRVSNMQLMAEENDAQAIGELQRARRELQEEENHVRELTERIAQNNAGSSNGVRKDDLMKTWLEQSLKTLTTEAEMRTMNIMRRNIDDDFLYFSPIGATLNRKERHIGFVESNYMEMLRALNAARLRLKNLQMTTATLRVLNPPMFPINSAPNNRLMVLLASFFISLLATAAYFFVIELLDRTLRDRRRTEHLTKCPVIGCYPQESSLRYRKYNKVIADMAIRQLSKALLPHIDNGGRNIINLLSTAPGDGKSYVANELEELWMSMGLQVRRITYDEDFLTDDATYILAQRVEDLCPDFDEKEVLIIEYPPLDEHEVPPTLINQGTLNIVVARANRTWKDIDDKALRALLSRLIDKSNIFFYLTEAGREAVQEFTGQLPPYTPFKNFTYRMSQLGLTASENAPRGK